MSRVQSFDIVYNDIPLEGVYEYEPPEAATKTSPGWPARVWINTIMVRGTAHNLLELLHENIILDMEDKILERNHQ